MKSLERILADIEEGYIDGKTAYKVTKALRECIQQRNSELHDADNGWGFDEDHSDMRIKLYNKRLAKILDESN